MGKQAAAVSLFRNLSQALATNLNSTKTLASLGFVMKPEEVYFINTGTDRVGITKIIYKIPSSVTIADQTASPVSIISDVEISVSKIVGSEEGSPETNEYEGEEEEDEGGDSEQDDPNEDVPLEQW